MTLSKAADLAKQIVFGGMSELGIVSPEDVPKELLHKTITGIINEVESQVKKLINNKKALFTQLVDLVMSRECLSGNEFRDAIGTSVQVF